MASARRGSGGSTGRHGDGEEPLNSLWPHLDDAEFLEVTESIPVAAFGLPITKFAARYVKKYHLLDLIKLILASWYTFAPCMFRMCHCRGAYRLWHGHDKCIHAKIITCFIPLVMTTTVVFCMVVLWCTVLMMISASCLVICSVILTSSIWCPCPYQLQPLCYCLIWIWAGKFLQSDLASTSKLFLITFTRVLARCCGQEGWFYFCYYDVHTGQVFVFCVNWCLLGHIYKIGCVLCCWVSLFICVCILNCYVWFTCFYYLCSALVLTILLQWLLCIGWGHSDVIGIIKLEFCRVTV